MTDTPSQDCPQCGRFVQDRPNYGLHCECGWKQLRADRTPRAAADTPPLPAHLDPDTHHRTIRDRLFAHHPGPPQRLLAGGYGLEPGDQLTWRRQVWTVTAVRRWPEDNGHTLVLDPADGDAAVQVTVPWNFRGALRDHNGDERVEVLTSSHHPVCGDCGQPWPCRDVDEGYIAHHAVRDLLKQVEHETANPHLCRVCEKRRFATDRGRRQHERHCVTRHAHPARQETM